MNVIFKNSTIEERIFVLSRYIHPLWDSTNVSYSYYYGRTIDNRKYSIRVETLNEENPKTYIDLLGNIEWFKMFGYYADYYKSMKRIGAEKNLNENVYALTILDINTINIVKALFSKFKTVNSGYMSDEKNAEIYYLNEAIDRVKKIFVPLSKKDADDVLKYYGPLLHIAEYVVENGIIPYDNDNDTGIKTYDVDTEEYVESLFYYDRENIRRINGFILRPDKMLEKEIYKITDRMFPYDNYYEMMDDIFEYGEKLWKKADCRREQYIIKEVKINGK